MTNANTPTTREREVAREIASHYPRNLYGRQYHDCIDRIAAALARERREAEHEQMERDCQVVCNWCKNYPGTLNAQKTNHIVSGSVWTCMAQRIYAAAIEALRDEP